MAQFRKHLNIAELERSIVVALIDRILIYMGQPRGSPLPLCGRICMADGYSQKITNTEVVV